MLILVLLLEKPDVWRMPRHRVEIPFFKILILDDLTHTTDLASRNHSFCWQELTEQCFSESNWYLTSERNRVASFFISEKSKQGIFTGNWGRNHGVSGVFCHAGFLVNSAPGRTITLLSSFQTNEMKGTVRTWSGYYYRLYKALKRKCEWFIHNSGIKPNYFQGENLEKQQCWLNRLKPFPLQLPTGFRISWVCGPPLFLTQIPLNEHHFSCLLFIVKLWFASRRLWNCCPKWKRWWV